MNILDQLITDATAKIEGSYFLLPTLGDDKLRERVYAYELYHQMRSKWTLKNLILNGEVDKKGHPRFPPSNEPQPDLIIHEPGTENNLAVFEIKSSGAQKREIVEDLNKLHLFLESLHYERAIYLIYGTNSEACANKIVKLSEYSNKVEIWLHQAPLTSAYRRY